MTITTIRPWYLVTAAILAAMMSGFLAWLNAIGEFPSDHVFGLYTVIFNILMISWFVTDPDLPAIQRPSFDHGFLLLGLFPLLALYHMFITRRWRGILIILGMQLLFFAPIFVVLLVAVVG